MKDRASHLVGRSVPLIGLGLMVCVLTLGLMPQAAFAAPPSWVVQPTPNPPSPATDTMLSAVSCSSSAFCAAVGSYSTAVNSFSPLAEIWNGTAWTIEATPSPTGATRTILDGVSCGRANACTAVGWYETPHAILALVEVWNGSDWAIQPIKKPSSGATTELNAVSCTSARDCTAVGGYTASKKSETGLALAEVWNGSVWTAETAPSPAGATDAEFSAVSCSSGRICTAAGDYVTTINGTRTGLPLIEAWDRAGWTIQSAPTPPETTSASLNGVSCTSLTACTAAGDYVTSPDGTQTVLTLVEVWNGSEWTVEPSPNPPGQAISTFQAISCIGTTCSAVGAYSASDTGTEPTVTLAERWNGTKWSIQQSPAVDSYSWLFGVSCISARVCTAAGVTSTTPSGTGTSLSLAERSS